MINKWAIKCVMCIALVRIEKYRVVLIFVRKINAVALVSRNRNKNEKSFFTIHPLFPSAPVIGFPRSRCHKNTNVSCCAKNGHPNQSRTTASKSVSAHRESYENKYAQRTLDWSFTNNFTEPLVFRLTCTRT